jgi:hypothetical protein
VDEGDRAARVPDVLLHVVQVVSTCTSNQ